MCLTDAQKMGVQTSMCQAMEFEGMLTENMQSLPVIIGEFSLALPPSADGYGDGTSWPKEFFQRQASLAEKHVTCLHTGSARSNADWTYTELSLEGRSKLSAFFLEFLLYGSHLPHLFQPTQKKFLFAFFYEWFTLIIFDPFCSLQLQCDVVFMMFFLFASQASAWFFWNYKIAREGWPHWSHLEWV